MGIDSEVNLITNSFPDSFNHINSQMYVGQV